MWTALDGVWGSGLRARGDRSLEKASMSFVLRWDGYDDYDVNNDNNDLNGEVVMIMMVMMIMMIMM